jgi:hypothetical protein
MLVTDRAMTQAGTLTLSGTGVTTAFNSDNTLAVGGAGTLHVGETILIDAERMVVVDTSGSSYIVDRARDGSVLATHTAGATISALRLLTVMRGALGTTAATHTNTTAVSKYRTGCRRIFEQRHAGRRWLRPDHRRRTGVATNFRCWPGGHPQACVAGSWAQVPAAGDLNG